MTVLSAVINITVDKNQLFEIFCVYKQNDERFTSINYTVAKKTIDYVVEMKNKVIGKVKFYFEYENVFYVLLEQYEHVAQIHHIQEITPKNIESVYAAADISNKFIYVNFLAKHYITLRPNQFESD